MLVAIAPPRRLVKMDSGCWVMRTHRSSSGKVHAVVLLPRRSRELHLVPCLAVSRPPHFCLRDAVLTAAPKCRPAPCSTGMPGGRVSWRQSVRSSLTQRCPSLPSTTTDVAESGNIVGVLPTPAASRGASRHDRPSRSRWLPPIFGDRCSRRRPGGPWHGRPPPRSGRRREGAPASTRAHRSSAIPASMQSQSVQSDPMATRFLPSDNIMNPTLTPAGRTVSARPTSRHGPIDAPASSGSRTMGPRFDSTSDGSSFDALVSPPSDRLVVA